MWYRQTSRKCDRVWTHIDICVYILYVRLSSGSCSARDCGTFFMLAWAACKRRKVFGPRLDTPRQWWRSDETGGPCQLLDGLGSTWPIVISPLEQDCTKLLPRNLGGIWRHSCTIRRGGILRLKWNGDPYMGILLKISYSWRLYKTCHPHIYRRSYFSLLFSVGSVGISLAPQTSHLNTCRRAFFLFFFFRRASLFHWLNFTATCSVAMTVL